MRPCQNGGYSYNGAMNKEEMLHLFRNLKDRNMRQEGIIIGESRFVVERMIASGLKIICGIGSGISARILMELSGSRFPVTELTEKEISSIIGYSFHRGMLAAAVAPEQKSISGYPDKGRGKDLLVLMPEPNIPENIGSVCRSASALGAGALILPSNGPYPYSRRVLRSSMGTILLLPVLTLSSNPAEDIILLKKRGYLFCGTSLKEGSIELKNFKPPDKTVLVLGNEAFGLSEEWEKGCDKLLTLKMENGTDSLNVAAAAGIFLYGMKNGQPPV